MLAAAPICACICAQSCWSTEATVSQEVYRHGLSRGRSILVDRSIQNALIYGIRRAKHFLYIESQYFEGANSCHYRAMIAVRSARKHVFRR